VSGAPPPSVLATFGVGGAAEPLAGGEGHSWRSGDLVLKPWDDDAEWLWLGEHLPTVRENGFRLALPVPALSGRWVVDGWCAQTWVSGEQPEQERWLEVLTVSERFHAACAHLPRPTFIDARTHHYAVADRVAWEEAASPISHPVIDRLSISRRPVDLPHQLVHGDLTENVLFDPNAPPAVIDPSPYWRPAGFGSAVVVADAITWHDADPAPLLDATAHIRAFDQLLIRAIIFRVLTSLLFARDGGVHDLGHERRRFERGAAIALQVAG
jgi:uncharacterized protein (TIGR02569 family)